MVHFAVVVGDVGSLAVGREGDRVGVLAGTVDRGPGRAGRGVDRQDTSAGTIRDSIGRPSGCSLRGRGKARQQQDPRGRCGQQGHQPPIAPVCSSPHRSYDRASAARLRAHRRALARSAAAWRCSPSNKFPERTAACPSVAASTRHRSRPPSPANPGRKPAPVTSALLAKGGEEESRSHALATGGLPRGCRRFLDGRLPASRPPTLVPHVQALDATSA